MSNGLLERRFGGACARCRLPDAPGSVCEACEAPPEPPKENARPEEDVQGEGMKPCS